jgi:flagellar motility protein MotE (MotC chaperone)
VKKIFDIFVLLLAINFLAIAGGAGWLYQSGHLDRKRVQAIKATLFPPPAPAAPTTQPAEAEGARAAGSKRLEDLLAKMAGKHTAAEQVEFIQQTFFTTMAQLDRRQVEIENLNQQLAVENQKLATDRKALDEERERLTASEQQSQRLASDKGFQDTLTLYSAMPPKQAKTVFMTLDDQTIAQYLDAMQPRTAAKIIKEFKSPDETERIKRVMEKIHVPPQPGNGATPTTQEAKDQ